jgi:hypothetical protein
MIMLMIDQSNSSGANPLIGITARLRSPGDADANNNCWEGRACLVRSPLVLGRKSSTSADCRTGGCRRHACHHKSIVRVVMFFCRGSRVGCRFKTVRAADKAASTEAIQCGKWGTQYSSPFRATRKSRLGSESSVAPHVAHLCSGSDSLRVDVSNRSRRVFTPRRCRAS